MADIDQDGKQLVGPPFTLTEALPNAQLLDCIIKTTIAARNGFLVSFESAEEIVQSAGIDFLATLALNLSKKPTRNKNNNASNTKHHNPFLAPFPVGQHVCDLNIEYKILLNKYNVVDNHILLVTSTFIPQHLLLNDKDFDISMRVILSKNGLCYFNCGPMSGASQPHKHLQIIPRNDRFPIESFVKNIQPIKVRCVSDSSDDIPLYVMKQYGFIHRVYLIEKQDKLEVRNRRLFEAYKLMMKEIKLELNTKQMDKTTTSIAMLDALISIFETDLDSAPFSYNMLLTEDYLFIVPRKHDEYCNEELFAKRVSIGVNGVTFAGTFFCKSAESLALLKQTGPLNVLNHVTFPR